MKKKLVQRLAALSLAVLTALPLAGCGNGEPSGNVTQKEWIYVPEFVTIEDEEASYYGMQLAGDSVYYTVWEWDEAAGRGYSNFRRFSLTDRQTETISLAWPDGGAAVNINEFVIGSDDSIYIVAYEPVPVPDSDEYMIPYSSCINLMLRGIWYTRRICPNGLKRIRMSQMPISGLWQRTARGVSISVRRALYGCMTRRESIRGKFLWILPAAGSTVWDAAKTARCT